MKKLVLSFITLLFVISNSTGSVPKTLSYQGVVTDSNGNPKNDGKYDFVFSIFNDSVSGKSLWSENKTIQTKQGLFSTELGSVSPLMLPFDTQYWLQVEADGTVFPQRTKLTSAPYSFRADTAEVAKKADTAQIAKGLVDSYYTREQLRDSGEAKVHAGNIVVAPWLTELGFNPDYFVQGENSSRTIYLDSNRQLDETMYSMFFLLDSDDPASPSENGLYGFRTMNTNLLYSNSIEIAGRANTGELYFGGLQGSIRQPWREIWHSGNFNPDYFVQGTSSRRSVRYDSTFPLDSNIFSAFVVLSDTDPSCPSTNAQYGFRVVHPDQDNPTVEIVGRPNSGELYFGGLHGGTRQPWREIWHSGNFTPETQSSDIRFKTDIDSIQDPLKKVNSLKGISFNWKHSDFPDRHFPEGRQIGVIAQEVEKILPEVVRTDKDGYKSVAYSKLSALLIEAVKEQQKIIEKQKNQIDKITENQKKSDEKLIELEKIIYTIKSNMEKK